MLVVVFSRPINSSKKICVSPINIDCCKILILGHIYKESLFFRFEPFCLRLYSKIVKCVNLIKKGYQKTQNLMLISYSFKKKAKIHVKKVINKKVTFIVVCKIFLSATFLVELFCTFFNGFKLSIEVCVL
jgi:hypothetical protein